MKFEIETEHLPAGPPRNNGRKLIVMIACTAVICVLLIIVYVKLESVNREDKGPGLEPGLNGSDKGQEGAPGAAGQPHEPGLPGSTRPKVKTGQSGPADPLGGVETSTDGIQNLTASKGIVEGIIAGTEKGVIIILLDSREQRRISSKPTNGVAFNWQSRKVYWIEEGVGIKIADLDGSCVELLISDANLHGLAVDHITGNIYFGVRGSNARIQVCDSMGKKCKTIASGVNNVGQNIWDIALLPSEGLMFWSNRWDKESVTRANIDGTNATKIILEDASGLYSDELTEKLYWANEFTKSIEHSDLNGYNRNVLLNTTNYPLDIAVDGDTLYFGGYHPSGVYSVTSNGQVSFIVNTNGVVYDMALFGRNKVPSRPNPCNNSPCTNLCVLTRVFYTCLLLKLSLFGPDFVACCN